MEQESGNKAAGGLNRWIKTAFVVLGVVVAIAAVVAAKNAILPRLPESSSSEASTAGTVGESPSSITSTRGDFSARYNAALSGGKPVFVYFHTLTCPSCKQFSPIIEKVMPAYEGKIIFVNALEEDPAAYDLATRYKFGYVPTSLFLKPGGAVDKSVVGPMTESELKLQLNLMADGK